MRLTLSWAEFEKTAVAAIKAEHPSYELSEPKFQKATAPDGATTDHWDYPTEVEFTITNKPVA